MAEFQTAPVTTGRACRFLAAMQEAAQRAVDDVSADTPEAEPAGPRPMTAAEQVADLGRRASGATGLGIYGVLTTDPEVRREVVAAVVVHGDGSDVDVAEADDVPAEAFAEAYALFLPGANKITRSLLGLTSGSA